MKHRLSSPQVEHVSGFSLQMGKKRQKEPRGHGMNWSSPCRDTILFYKRGDQLGKGRVAQILPSISML